VNFEISRPPVCTRVISATVCGHTFTQHASGKFGDVDNCAIPSESWKADHISGYSKLIHTLFHCLDHILIRIVERVITTHIPYRIPYRPRELLAQLLSKNWWPIFYLLPLGVPHLPRLPRRRFL
jgi:hypothetical protein